MNRMTNHERRAIHHGVKYDASITTLEVYNKYKGVCAHCRIKTVYGVHPQVANSATIEHKQPMNKGGAHEWKNILLLCHSCNSKANKRIQRRDEHIYSLKIFGISMEFKVVR